ncbi:MAG TPA: lysophospholipid acyltransferase family protein [Myxococcota bacterium]|nr:lysophospholipid acyltransferase family protein [Myxococcota bacterium]
MADGLSAGDVRALRLQRAVSRALSPLWIPIFVTLMAFAFRWRIEGAAELRGTYREIREKSRAPLLICANHLTMLDSFVIGWALGGSWWYLTHFSSLPWNTPERVHFASTWWKRALTYLLKCVPLTRGSDRKEVARVLEKVAWLLRSGEVVMVFPEGQRSRTARVEVESAAYGVGRIVASVPGCRVLCVYLRGDSQHEMTDAPARGEVFRGRAQLLEPKSDERGLRGSLDIARQIVAKLAELERSHFDARE